MFPFRQTFCTIMAHLTEETQPCFETTLKSRAVSEDNDVKFHCIVTGYPEPEVTWYKDDMEMDRYCGLPKYQIFRNGKKHSLHVFKCTEEDAAIYQASARNSKGIVSCSGILEVGTMSEYKIHQRWFGKLKQKAEAKRRELERGKENMQRAPSDERVDLLRTVNPEKAQRKRKSYGQARTASASSVSASSVSASSVSANKAPVPCSTETVEDKRKEVPNGGRTLLVVTDVRSVEKALVIMGDTDTNPLGSGGDHVPVKSVPDSRAPEVSRLPCILVGDVLLKEAATTSQASEELGHRELGTPPEQGRDPKLKPSESPPPIPSATPQELAAGARRKIFVPKSKQTENTEVLPLDALNMQPQPRKEEAPVTPPAPQAPRCSPIPARRMTMLQVPKLRQEPEEKSESVSATRGETVAEVKSSTGKSEAKTEEVKSTKNPFKAPQVIRKIRAEQFTDASGNLKLWCQFFNLLSDSTVRWFKDGLCLDELKRSAGDESQLALAIVQASGKDCGVYKCVVENDYGSDSTDFLLSSGGMSGFISREDVEVGEEIEMMPVLFAKSLMDSGFWADKFFGRIMMEEVHFGAGFLGKASRVKVIYGLDPIFDSGSTCIIKVRNCIAYTTKNENSLIERNHSLTVQECKLQNTAREYNKIFAAEARTINTFGVVPEIIPLHLVYRPANNIPYATIEEELSGPFVKYSMKDKNMTVKSDSEIGHKCRAFQHWIYQWTNGNLLVTDLQDRAVIMLKCVSLCRYQGLTGNCPSSIIEDFAHAHQCNCYCEALALKSIESLQQSLKPKAARSPLPARKASQSSPQVHRKTQGSPQVQRKGLSSPQAPRKGVASPKVSRKTGDSEDSLSGVKHKTVEIPKSVRLR
uniref:non-specific serine/threonine protein kinase n=1 Tax=Callorhinchus milii TaxID=7868 RepID=A0A4W3IJU7_CALMI